MCRTEPEAATETRLFEEKLPPQLARLRALKHHEPAAIMGARAPQLARLRALKHTCC